MKRIVLFIALCLPAFAGYSQNSVFTLFGGAGTSLNYNYDIGTSAGLSFSKIGHGRTGFGAQLLYQGYVLNYDKEQNGAKDGTGIAGVTIRDKASYIFVAPKISQFFTKGGFIEAYLNVGAGFKMSGKETLRKWDHTLGYYSAGSSDYDSTIDASNKLNSMLFRIGVGCTQYIHMGKSGKGWWFNFTEDLGFLTSSLTKSSDFNDGSRTPYSPAHKLNPMYISVQIGISRSKDAK